MDLVPHKGAHVNMYAPMWKGLSMYEGTVSKQEARAPPQPHPDLSIEGNRGSLERRMEEQSPLTRE